MEIHLQVLVVLKGHSVGHRVLLFISLTGPVCFHILWMSTPKMLPLHFVLEISTEISIY